MTNYNPDQLRGPGGQWIVWIGHRSDTIASEGVPFDEAATRFAVAKLTGERSVDIRRKVGRRARQPTFREQRALVRAAKAQITDQSSEAHRRARIVHADRAHFSRPSPGRVGGWIPPAGVQKAGFDPRQPRDPHTGEWITYFAFGSNLDIPALEARVNGTGFMDRGYGSRSRRSSSRKKHMEVIGPATLPGHRLEFVAHGVANVHPDQGGHVQGAIIRISPEGMKRLDRYEGAPGWYDRQNVRVFDPQGNPVDAVTYTLGQNREKARRPTPDYYGSIERGYELFGLDPAPLVQARRESKVFPLDMDHNASIQDLTAKAEAQGYTVKLVRSKLPGSQVNVDPYRGVVQVLGQNKNQQREVLAQALSKPLEPRKKRKPYGQSRLDSALAEMDARRARMRGEIYGSQRGKKPKGSKASETKPSKGSKRMLEPVSELSVSALRSRINAGGELGAEALDEMRRRSREFHQSVPGIPDENREEYETLVQSVMAKLNNAKPGDTVGNVVKLSFSRYNVINVGVYNTPQAAARAAVRSAMGGVQKAAESHYDPGQLRWPAGSPDGLGGQWMTAANIVNSPKVMAAVDRLASGDILNSPDARATQEVPQNVPLKRTAKQKEVLGDAVNTLVKHAPLGPDGKRHYTPERLALHRQIIKDILDNGSAFSKIDNGGHIAHAIKQFLFNAGGPAAGKSSAVKSGQQELPEDCSHLDLDFFKKVLPEYRALAGVDENDKPIEGVEPDEYASDAVHLEAYDLYRAALSEARKRGYNVYAEGCGNSGSDQFAEKIRDAKKDGYKVGAFYVTIPIPEAEQRSISRAKKENRSVPLEPLRAMHANVSRWFAQVKKELDAGNLDDLVVWSNDIPEGQKPIRLAHVENGQLVIDDPVRFKAFLDKQFENDGKSISLPSFV